MNELLEFCLDTENSQKNYNLGVWYENQNHTGPAHTYYLRAAERAEDKVIAYKSLLRSAICCKKQNSRDFTEKSLLKSAISYLPERPEAYYFLATLHEKKQEWEDCYMYSCLGLSCYNQNIEEIGLSEYPGKYGLIFQRAISSWWWGKGKESRELLHTLVDEYWDELDEPHKQTVEKNLTSLGSGPESQAFHTYTKEEHSKLRFKFNQSDIIERNYSQVYQDMFILSVLNGKRNGTFLEIGGAEPFKGSNTALLEKQFDWKGVSIEYDEKFIENYRNNRTTKLLHDNALTIDYNQLLSENFDSTVIDYLQLDIEPAKNTYECMLKIPFDKYKFAVITYEHDYYVDVTRSYREKSREFLKSKGYVLVVNDISPDGKSNFEDWWVHPELIRKDILEIMFDTTDNIKHCKEYIFTKKEVEINLNHYETKQEIIDGNLWETNELIANQVDVKEQNQFTFLSNPKKTVWVVDNFYDNPDEIRKFALEQEFGDASVITGFIGRRTFNQFLFPGLKEAFESVMDKKITAWEEHGMNGRFQICWSGEPLVYHCDSQKWGGMIYLTPDAPYQCGTTLYAHKKTRARTYYDNGWDASWVDVPGDCHLDGTPFEPVDVLGNVYNRLVIFDASCIHSASEYFGTVKENARLWQMFFFDT